MRFAAQLALTAAVTLVAAVSSLSSTSAMAEYPEKPIRLVIPFPAGGASDQAARVFGDALSKKLGQPLIYDNRGGANGIIAAQNVYVSPPDGYTLLWGVASMPGAPVLQRDVPYASMSEFVPIALVGRLGTGLFVNADVPAKSLDELAKLARTRPDSLNFAAANFGEYMTTWQYMKAAGISMTRIPYKGGAQAMPDLVAGRVQVYVTPVSLGLQHVQAGKLRLLATIGNERFASTPGVPTFAEAGFANVVYPSWQAVFGPPKMPQAIADRLGRDAASVLADPAVRAQLERQVITPGGETLQALAVVVSNEEKRWQTFVRDNGIVPE